MELSTNRASPELSAQLSRINYQALITTKGGREIAKQLVTSLMQQQIGQQVSVSTMLFIHRILRLTSTGRPFGNRLTPSRAPFKADVAASADPRTSFFTR